MSENFAVSLKQGNLASKSNIADFIKNFDDKLKHLNKKSSLNKTKHVLVQDQLNNLSEKVRLISTKGLTKVW